MIAFSPESRTTWLSPYSHSYTTASPFVILMLRFPCVSRIPHTCATRPYHRSDMDRQGCPQGAFSLCIVYAPLKASHALKFSCQDAVLSAGRISPISHFHQWHNADVLPAVWGRIYRTVKISKNGGRFTVMNTFYRVPLCSCVFRQCNYTMTKKLMQIVVSLHF